MPILADYRTEDELLDELQQKKIVRSKRTLRQWRQRCIGPPWAEFNKIILYPNDGFEKWLRSLVQQPVRSRRAA